MADDIDRLVDNEARYGQNTVIVKVPVSAYQNTYLPVDNGEGALSCVFRKMTIDDSLLLEKLSFTEKTENNMDMSFCDFNVYRKLMLRRCLLVFGEKELERENGWVTKDDWHRLLRINAMVLCSVLNEFESVSSVTEEEEQRIDRQAGILFGSDNSRVMNPVPSMSMYCTLAAIWDKFGISLDDLKKMDNSDYLKIRQILSKEVETMKREAKR